jgi:hypothetical protein
VVSCAFGLVGIRVELTGSPWLRARDTELIDKATDIRLRTERRAGQLLAEVKETGERDAGRKGKIELRPATQLADLGVTTQSSGW